MGSVVKRGADGVWYARLYLGTNAHGRPIRPYRSFPGAATREEAQRLADDWAASLTADGQVRSARLADLLAEYVETRERLGCSPNTAKTYRTFCAHAARHFGGKLARDVSTVDVMRWENELLAAREEGGAGLSRNSVLGAHHFLRGAFNHLVEIGVVDVNPVVAARPPSPERHEAAVVDEWDYPALATRLAERMAGPMDKAAMYAFAAWISLRTGLRVGEVCALRRRDLSRSGGYVHVGGTVIERPNHAAYRRDVTKGRRSRNVSMTGLDVSRAASFVRRRDEALGPLPADAPLVTLDGSWMRPTSVSRSFTRLAKELGLPRGTTFHSLRHTHATWCITAGVDLKTLSERLGHADEATTLRIYAHVLKGRDEAAAKAFSDMAAKAAE